MGEYSTYIIYKNKYGKIKEMSKSDWHELSDIQRKSFKYLDAYNPEFKQHRNFVKKIYGLGA